MRTITFIIIIWMLHLSAFATDFIIYDSIGQKDKPDLSIYGLKPFRLIGSQFLWHDMSNMNQPDFAQLDIVLANSSRWESQKAYGKDVLCLDIEHWHLRNVPDHVIDSNLEKFNNIYNHFKAKLPNTKIGFYAMFPIREYWSVVNKNHKEIEKWHNNNSKLYKVASNMDIIFPSLYTFYKDKHGWLKYAKTNIQEAKKYGKPVVVFIWPQFHSSNRFQRYKFLDAEFWKIQLETAYNLADGVVIWTPSGNARSNWDPEAPWWKATLEFINENNLSTFQPNTTVN